MTDQDNLRDRIETVLDRFTGESWEHHHQAAAQAIIDDLGLTVEERKEFGYAGRVTRPAQSRIVGKWVEQ